MGLLLVEFEGAEVWGFAGEVVVDGGEDLACVDRFGLRFETEVEIHRMVDMVAAVDVGLGQVFEDIVIELDAVGFLAGGLFEFVESCEGAHLRAGSSPVVLLGYVAIRAEAVVVCAEAWRRVSPGHDAFVGGVAAEEDVVAEVGV